jgi:hypothetical protein
MTDQLRRFFESYCETYDRFDPDGAAAFITRPLVIVRAGEVTVYDTPEEIRAFFAKLLEWFTGIRHGKGSISRFEVRPLGESSAFVNVVELPRVRGRLSAWVTSGYPQAAREAPVTLTSAQPCG